MAPLRILPDVTGSRLLKMAAAKPEGLTAAIFKNRLPVTSDSIRINAIVLLDPENGGLAVGTASLSGLEAEI